MRRLLLGLIVLLGIGLATTTLYAEETVDIQRGQQLVIWPLGETTADQVFRSVTVACQRQANQDWLCYIPEHRRTNFTIRNGDVLWVSSPLAQTIRLEGDPSPAAAVAGCNFTDATTAVFASTFQVITSNGSGTAFYIGNGEFLTAAHVVDGGGRIQLRTQAQRLTATLVGLDGQSDLALLRADGTGLTALPFADHDALRPGQTLGVPGVAEDFASRPGRPSVSSGVLSKIVERNGVTYIQTSAETNPGNSGGALFTGCGEIVGVIHGGFEEDGGRRIEGINYAVALPTIWEQLPHLRAGHIDAASVATNPAQSSAPELTALCNVPWDDTRGEYVPYDTPEACRIAGQDGIKFLDAWYFWGIRVLDWESTQFRIDGGPAHENTIAGRSAFDYLAPGEHTVQIRERLAAGEWTDWGEPYSFIVKIVMRVAICDNDPASFWDCYIDMGYGFPRGFWIETIWASVFDYDQAWYSINNGEGATEETMLYTVRNLPRGTHTIRVGEFRSWGWTGWSPPFTFTIR